MNHCPDRDLLERLLDDRLADTEVDDLERHVKECASCQRTLDELTDDRLWTSAPLRERKRSCREAKLARRDATDGAFAGADGRSARVVPAVPGYEITGELGRGGMGAVFQGRDPDLGRDVAVKVLRDDYRDDAEMVRRFVEEARIGGQLHHPGVVPIHELGTLADRRPFFAMKLVRGYTLAGLLGARKGPDDDRPRFLAIFEDICQTVAYAHARGVVHRDLKPSNVMVGPFGEVQVMDWGLAKVLSRRGVDEEAGRPDRPDSVIPIARSGSDALGLSRPGSALGTPGYMAPEQARGEPDRVDERADVFALGSILGEILTGEPAFVGRSSAEILRRASMGDTADALARLDACGADDDLVAIARDCLAREAEDRPRHAGAVAERVTAYLAGVQDRLRAAELARAAETARAEEAIARARAERSARRFQVGLAASLLVLTAAGGLAFTYLLHQRQERAAKYAQVLAEATAMLGKARLDPGDPGAWRDALAALGRAEDHGPGDRVAALRAEIKAGLDAAERDARLRQELVEIWANREDMGPEGTDSAYAAAFRAARLDLDALEPAESARRLKRRPEAVAIELAVFLDDWSAARRDARRLAAAWRRPLEAARLADPEPYRDRLRAILLGGDLRREADALKALAAAPEASELPPPTAVLLGRSLTGLGQATTAVALLRPAAARYPGDVWVNYHLAWALEKLGPSASQEAVRYYTAARALRPETAHELAHLLERMGRGAEAEAIFRDLTARRPKVAAFRECLAMCLMGLGRPAEATRTLEHATGTAEAHATLGSLSLRQRKLDQAVAEYRAAIRLEPGNAEAHFELGNALERQGKRDAAIAEFREACRLRPDFADAHHLLGYVLHLQGRNREAIPEYRAAIRLAPDEPWPHTRLGEALNQEGRRPEAASEFREVVRLVPYSGVACFNVAQVILSQGHHEPAIALLARAVEWDFENNDHLGMAVGLLAQTYRDLGRYDEAVATYRRVASYPQAQPNDIRWAEDAIAMTEVHRRSHAARAAARAGCGLDHVETPPDEAARARLRAQALEWFQTELDRLARVPDQGPGEARAGRARVLEFWKRTGDLAGVREAAALAKLPDAERGAWRSLWAEVDARLARLGRGRR